MEISTLIGVVSGLAFLVIGIFWGGGDLMAFFDPSSIMITFGGAIAGLFIGFTIKDVASLPKLMGMTFKKAKGSDPVEVIGVIIRLANVARKEGLLALEEEVKTLDDKFLQKGVMLIVDGTDAELVKDILEADMGAMESRHAKGIGVMDLFGANGPAFGMLGTLIGLIIMLGNLSDPSTLGSGMATALVTTFYGSLLSNLFCIPMAQKLKVYSADEMAQRELVLEGLLSIQAGENPRIIEEKLYSFLPPSAKKPEENRERE